MLANLESALTVQETGCPTVEESTFKLTTMSSPSTISLTVTSNVGAVSWMSTETVFLTIPPFGSVCIPTVKFSAVPLTTGSTIVCSVNDPLLLMISNGSALEEVGGATVKSESFVVP